MMNSQGVAFHVPLLASRLASSDRRLQPLRMSRF